MAIYIDGKLVANKGKDGVGVPNGGKTGQVLTKNSDNDFDTTWKDIPTGITMEQVNEKINSAIQSAIIDSWNASY